MKRHLVIPILILGVLSACVSQAAERSGDASPTALGDAAATPVGGLVLVGTNGGMAAAEMSTGKVLFNEERAIASPDRSLVYSTSHGALRVLEADSGDVVDSFPAPAGTIPIAASEEGLVALIPTGAATYPAAPEGRLSTPVDIADTESGDAQHLNLHGNFEPEAFSTDGRSLFLIQYLPAAAPDHYRVMELALASEKIFRVASPDKVPPSSMQGTRLQQVWAPDRSVLYTLYTNQVSSGAPLTFVHVLNLAEKWAHCIDLPPSFGSSRPSAKAMVGSPDGKHLYVTDADAQLIATINTRRFAVQTTDVADVPSPQGREPASASLAADGTLYVSGGDRVSMFNVGTMTPGPAWTSDSLILDEALSPDGTILFLSTADGIQARDPDTGTSLGAARLPGARVILAVSAR
jgi:hypothetical protein